MDKIDLSNQALKRRLASVANQAKNKELLRIAEDHCGWDSGGYLERIVSQILKTRDIEKISRNFFEGFPDVDKIVYPISKYKNDREAIHPILKGIGQTLCDTKDIKDVQRLTEVFSGKSFESFIERYKNFREGKFLDPFVQYVQVIDFHLKDKDLSIAFLDVGFFLGRDMFDVGIEIVKDASSFNPYYVQKAKEKIVNLTKNITGHKRFYKELYEKYPAES